MMFKISFIISQMEYIDDKINLIIFRNRVLYSKNIFPKDRSLFLLLLTNVSRFISEEIDNLYISHRILYPSLFDKEIYMLSVENIDMSQIKIKCLTCGVCYLDRENYFSCNKCAQRLCMICKSDMYDIKLKNIGMCFSCYKDHCEICKSTDSVEFGLCRSCLCESIRVFKKDRKKWSQTVTIIP